MSFVDSVQEWLAKAVKPRHLDLAERGVIAGESLTPDYMSFRNTYWGQQHPVNYKLLYKMYKEDPVVNSAINLTKDFVVGDGWELIGDEGSELHRKRLERILNKNNFTNTLNDLVLCLLIYGDAYLELVRSDTGRKKFAAECDIVKHDVSLGSFGSHSWTEEKGLKRCYIDDREVQQPEFEKQWEYEYKSKAGTVKKMVPMDPSTVRVDYNEHGEPIKYIQRVLHRRVDFYPDEVVHFSLNKIGARVYGHSPMQSLLVTLQAKQNAENYTNDFFKRGAMPRMVYVLPGNYQKDMVDRFKNTLATLQPQQDVVLTGGQEVKVQDVAPHNSDMQFIELLKYLRLNILIALQVPPSMIGISEGANRSNSTVQMQAFDRRVHALKSIIADILNWQLFTSENFGSDDVVFKFQDKNVRENLLKAQEAQLLSTMVATGIVTANEVRDKLELKPLGIEGVQSEDRGLKIPDPDVIIAERQMAQAKLQADKMAAQGIQPGMPAAGGKPGGFNQQGQANPMKSQVKTENAAALNTSAANESRAESQPKKPSVSEKLVPDYMHYYTSPRGSIEDYERAAKEIEEYKKSAHYARELAYAEAASERGPFASGSVLSPAEKKDRARELRERYLAHEEEEDQRNSEEHEKEGYEDQGSIRKPLEESRKVSTNVGGMQRYPFGATPIYPEAKRHQAAVQEQVRTDEIREVAGNTVGNAFELNNDREFPKEGVAGKDIKVSGKTKTRGARKKRELPRAPQDPERDEVNAAGRKVWAAPNSERF